MSGGSIEHRTKSGSNFAPTFVVHHVLPDINFNRHCLINNIYMRKIYINIYIYIYKYPHTRVLSFPGLVSVARVNE